jgi:hypothetical protein
MAKETKRPGATPQASPQHDWSKTMVSGFENVQREDLGIPFLMILQSLSPQIKKTDKNYQQKKIDGAEEGDIINTVANVVVCGMGEKMDFIPCGHQRLYPEWTPRTAGGGLVRTHQSSNILNECKRNERNQDVLPNGNIIVTTAYVYGIAIIDGEKIPCIIGLSSTQLKKSRMWLNMMMTLKMSKPDGTKFTPPMYSHVYKISTTPESNESGSWYGWKVEVGEVVKDPVLIAESMDYARRATTIQRQLSAPPEAPNAADDVVT